VGVFCYHAGANLVNDLYDQETDRLNQGATLFNGGSQVLPRGLASVGQMRKAALICYVLGTLSALVLTFSGGGWGALLFTLAGFGCGYFYSAPPFRLAATGWGELVVGLAFGPFLVLGTVAALTGAFLSEALLVSLPVGLLIAAVIIINELPDYESDRFSGKRTLVVRWGPEKSLRLLAWLLSTAVFLLLLILLQLRVYPLLIGLLVSIPLSGWVWGWGRLKLKQGGKLVRACAGMILLHLVNGVVLILAVWYGGS
jgi:1,4-dihydroxy-2-naphthoate octaprenyltransferase